MNKTTVHLSIAWWFKWLYMPLMQTAIEITRTFVDADAQLDEVKLERVLQRAIKVKVLK